MPLSAGLIFLRSLCALLALCLSMYSHYILAQQPQVHGIKMRMGLSAVNFNYEEQINGSQVNAEDGNIPGVYLAFKEQGKRTYGELIINYAQGQVDYSGQAQDNLGNFLGLVSTETDTELLDLNYRVGGRVYTPVELYAGLGYRYWRRDINPTTLSGGAPVDGLIERFSWFYALFGGKYHFIDKADLGVAINVQARRMIDPKISAKNSTINTRFDLEESWGYQLSLPVRFKLSAPYALTIEPFAKRWQLDQASDANGNLLPENETDIYGVHFVLSW